MVQLALILVNGAVVASWLVLAASVGVSLGSVSLLGRLAAASQRRSEVSAPVTRRTSMSRAPVMASAVPERESRWTPVPVPKPLYLSRSVAPTQPMGDPAAQLRTAASTAEEALRVAQRTVPVIILEAPTPAAAPSRFARMGIVDDATTAAPDLDAVLARRRAAG